MILDIILIITGIVIFTAGIIFTGDDKEGDNGSFFTKEGILEKQNIVDEMVKSRLETLSEEAIVDTDDTLSKISNEKIMSINEFSETNLEKIKENHDHVVFLYNMLNAKDDEIKQTLADMENAKQSMKETVSEVVRLTRQLNSALKKGVKNENPSETGVKASGPVKAVTPASVQQKEKKEKPDFRKSSSIMADEASGQMNLPELMQSDNKNEEILRLHKEGRSILDISKALNLGQGEVKLVIDLYGA